VYIEANVKKWGLAPASGSLAPPPPYGSEQGDLLLQEGSRDGTPEPSNPYHQSAYFHYTHTRSGSAQLRLGTRPPTSPGPQRSPTDISLAQFSLIDSNEYDHGEGSSHTPLLRGDDPPDYESPESSPTTEFPASRIPPIPSYDAAVADSRRNQDSRR
jgi:hypothetical protein